MIPLPLLQQREIEAAAIAPLVRAFAKEVGEERAMAILTDAIGELAHQSGCAAAAAVGGNDLAHFKMAIERWKAGGALEFEVLRDDAEAFEFNVIRCRYAEMYRRLGLEKFGPILSCSRDAEMIEGFNPEIGFTRTQTLMEGASHCDFRYRRGS
ncbi:MAG TPA: L-2-amino-thiazoline-4-carboxylic acid hydrolase [Urbifossiella sp.]